MAVFLWPRPCKGVNACPLALGDLFRYFWRSPLKPFLGFCPLRYFERYAPVNDCRVEFNHHFQKRATSLFFLLFFQSCFSRKWLYRRRSHDSGQWRVGNCEAYRGATVASTAWWLEYVKIDSLKYIYKIKLLKHNKNPVLNLFFPFFIHAILWKFLSCAKNKGQTRVFKPTRI